MEIFILDNEAINSYSMYVLEFNYCTVRPYVLSEVHRRSMYNEPEEKERQMIGFLFCKEQ